MTYNINQFMYQFIEAMDEAALDYDFDSLSQEEQLECKKRMKEYIDELFVTN